MEDKLQSECVRWFRYQYPRLTLFAIPNGGKRNAVTGAMLKKTGTLAGVADLFLMHAAGGYNGLFIEMKVGRNVLTKTQKDFAAKCLGEGYAHRVCRSVDEFVAAVNDYVSDLPQK